MRNFFFFFLAKWSFKKYSIYHIDTFHRSLNKISSDKIDMFIYLQCLYVHPLLKIRAEVWIWAGLLWQRGCDQVPLSSPTLCLLPNGWYQVLAVVLDPVFLGFPELSLRGSASDFTPEWRTFPMSGPKAERRPGSNRRGPRGSAFQAAVPRSGVYLHMRPKLSPLLLPYTSVNHSTRKKSPCTREP